MLVSVHISGPPPVDCYLIQILLNMTNVRENSSLLHQWPCFQTHRYPQNTKQTAPIIPLIGCLGVRQGSTGIIEMITTIWLIFYKLGKLAPLSDNQLFHFHIYSISMCLSLNKRLHPECRGTWVITKYHLWTQPSIGLVYLYLYVCGCVCVCVCVRVSEWGSEWVREWLSECA